MKHFLILSFILFSLSMSSQNSKIDNIVPFSVVESVPIYPGCEKAQGNQGKKQCMSKKIAKYINKKFNTSIASNLGLEGKQRVNVIFKIDRTGSVIDVRARAPHPDITKEAIRVIKRLPKMKPGKQKGKAVIVPYSLPIIFMVQSKKKKDPFDDPFFKKTGN